MSSVTNKYYPQVEHYCEKVKRGCELLGVVSGYLTMVMGHNLKVDAAVNELARKTGRPVDKVHRLVEGRAYKFSSEVRTYRKYGLLFVLSSVLVWNMADQIKERARED